MSTPNRRKHTRVKPRQITARIRAGEALHIGLGIENISVGGAFVKCNTPMKVGVLVSLEIQRAGVTQPLIFPARVTSCVSMADATRTGRAAGVGLKFDVLPPHLENWLNSLVAANAPQPVVTAAPVLAPPPIAQRTIPAMPPPRLAPVPPPSPPSEDFDATQTGIPAFVPAGRREEDQLRNELQALRTLLVQRDEKIKELAAENRKLKVLLNARR